MALSNANTIRQGLINRGLPSHVAEGFVMNFQDESGLDPGISEASPTVAGSRGGFGLYQLTGPRRVAYESFAANRGADPSDVDAQLDFMMQELSTTERGALSSLRGTSTAGEAGAVIVNEFLRPAEEHRASRSAQYLGQQVAQADTGTQTDAVQDWAPVHNAFLSGQMTPEQQTIYQDSIKSGDIPAMAAPTNILDAYTSGTMTPEQTAQFDAAVEAGIWALPEAPEEERGFFGNIIESVTGSARTTPEIEGMMGWQRLPELNRISPEMLKTTFAGAMANTDELADIIQTQFPEMGMRRDDKGNYIFKSSDDGKEYAIKPGVTLGDIPRAIFGIAAFVGGKGRSLPYMMGRSAAVETGQQALQAASGGQFDPEQITLAAGGEAIVPAIGAVAKPAVTGLKGLFGRLTRSGGDVLDTALVQQAGKTAPDALSDEAVGAIVRRAAQGNAPAQAKLAEMAAVNPEALAAAQRLGIELPADVLADAPMIQAAAGLPRSIAGSEAEAAWFQTIKAATEKADDAMTSLGSADSIAAISDDVLTSLNGTRNELADQAKTLYDSVDDLMPKTTEVAPNNIVGTLNEIITELGGEQGMSAAEKRLFKLVTSDQPVTYARLMREKNLIGKAIARGDSPYSSLDGETLARLYGAISADQLDNVAMNAGEEAADNLRRANSLYSSQKDLEAQIISAFGKDTQGSIANTLNAAIRNAAKGDAAKLNRILEVIPKDMQREAVATAIMSSSRATRGGVGEFGFAQFTKLYDGLRQNSPVYSRVIGALGPEGHKLMRDLYQVSSRITSSRARVLTTGKANQALVQGMTAEGLVSSILQSSAGKRALAGASATGGSIVAGPAGAGMGAALSSMLTSGGKDIMEATGKLFASDAFTKLATEMATSAEIAENSIKAVANSPSFMAWAKLSGVTDPTAWLTATMQSLKDRPTFEQE